MKKLFLLLACTSMAVGCFAQNNDAKTLFDSGKAKFAKFDELQAKLQMKQPVDTNELCSNFMGGYNDLVKALPLDTIVEKEKDGTPKIDKKTGKVKVKTKYSKEIVGLIKSHFNDFALVGDCYNRNKDYVNAANAWVTYAELPKAEFMGDNKPVLADSTAGMFYHYAGIMYYQAKDDHKALDAFSKALQCGYDIKDVREMLKYEYGRVIGDYLEKKEYAQCEAMIDKAIAQSPNEALYVMFKGIYIESKDDNIEPAFPYYEKAVQMDSTLAQAQYHVGRYYNNKAVNLMNADSNKNLTDAELGKIINPICEKAKPYLEKAVELDSTNTDAQRLLNWVLDRLAK